MTVPREWPRTAISVDGDVVDLPNDVADTLRSQSPDFARECGKWRSRHGSEGRIIVIDPTLVEHAQRLISEDAD